MPKRARSKRKPDRIAVDSGFGAPVTEKERSIVEAAVALIGQRGIDGATTAEIARRAGVTERTLFRYFPTKQDLVRRVLYPLLVQGGIVSRWEAFEEILKAKGPDFKTWYVAAAKTRFGQVSENPTRTRTAMTELVQNADLRDAMTSMWQQHIWAPMVAQLKNMQAGGQVRTDVDAEVLARMIHFLQAGYFLARHVFAPKHGWDDAGEFEQMGEILARGARRR
jgi:AcrR family transcriptional regulator